MSIHPDNPDGLSFADRLSAVAAPSFGLVRMGGRTSGRVDFEAPSSEWRERIADAWWSTENSGANGDGLADVRFSHLRRGLLAFGGAEVCLLKQDPALDQLLSRGQLWSGADTEVAGERGLSPWKWSQDFWEKNLPAPSAASVGAGSIILPAVGYALAPDGFWREHAWCIRAHPEEGGKPVDTAADHLLYFGVVYPPGVSFLTAAALSRAPAEIDRLVQSMVAAADVIASEAFDTPRVREAETRILADGPGKAPRRGAKGERVVTPSLLGLPSGLA